MWVRERGVGESLNYSIGDGIITVTAIKEGECFDNGIKPFLKLPAIFAESLFKSISDYNSRNGIKTPDENLLQGKLLATEEHLKDMREFSKKLLDASLKI